MRIPIFALLLSCLFVYGAGTVSAADVLTDTEVSVPVTNTESRPLLREQMRGAQDQFLQHQNQVKVRAAEFKDAAAARIKDIPANVMERRDLARENIAERREAMKGIILERRELQGMEPEERAEAMRVHIEERKAMLMEKRAAFASTTQERREKFSEKLGERPTAQFDQAIRLLNAMIVRLSGLADRIDARINEIAADGGDTAAAEDALASARVVIAEAETSVQAVADAIADALASETPRESLQATRPLAEDAKAAIRGAHEALKKAAGALPRPTLEAGS